jgi:ABC-type nitrate/sulfonate/bicarbonate transport system substrate-binding protein
VAKNLIEALDEAIESIRKEPARTKQFLEKYLGMTKEQLKYLGFREYVTNKELVAREKLVGSKTYDPVADYQKISDIFFEEGVLKNRIDVSELIYRK